MIELKTFGGLYLTDGGHVVECSRLRLALLLLVAEANSRGVGRERLTALLWPDSSDELARHSLHQLLSALRQRLGRDLFEGTDPIRLNPAVLASDLAAVARAVRAGDLEAVSRLTSGPLADGFSLGNDGGFDEWLDRQRAAYAEQRLDALRRLAQAADAGEEAGAAVSRWRQYVLADPLRTDGALGLMRALARAGDTPAAVQHARVHREIVRAQLDLPADRSVAELERELAAPPRRQAPAPAPDGASPAPDAAANAAPREAVAAGRQHAGRAPHPWLAPLAALVLLAAVSITLVAIGRPRSPGTSLPQRITYMGDAAYPSMSPSGKWIAYLSGTGPLGHGPVDLILKDRVGGEARELARFRYAIRVRWSSDERFVVVQGGLTEGDRESAYAVSVTGGAPRRLECCGGFPDPLSDTLYFSRGTETVDTLGVSWIRLMTIGDGIRRDSFGTTPPRPVHSLPMAHRSPLGAPFLIHRWYRDGSGFQLVTRDGRGGNELFFPFSAVGNVLPVGWLPDGSGVLLGATSLSGVDGVTIIRYGVRKLRLNPVGDTLLKGLGALVDPNLSESGDLVYAGPGPRTNVFALERTGTHSGHPYEARQLGEWTGNAVGRSAPQDGRILVQVPVGGARYRFEFHLFEPGEQRKRVVGPPVDGVRQWGWLWDGSAAWLAREDGERVALERLDLETGQREFIRFAELDQAYRMKSLPNGQFLGLQSDHKNMILLGVEPGEDRIYLKPAWSAAIDELSDSPDGRFVVVCGYGETGMEFVLARLDLDSGQWTRLPFARPAYRTPPLVFADGTLLAPETVPTGPDEWYWVAPDGARRPAGTMPVPKSIFDFGRDGRHAVASQQIRSGDVYVLPEFGRSRP